MSERNGLGGLAADLRSERLSAIPGVVHGFLRSFAELPNGACWRPRQVHGAAVARIRAADDPVLEADAATCETPGVPLAVVTADCVPVLIAREDGGAVAAVHAGWRGAAAGIVEAATDALGGRAAGLVAALGPSAAGWEYEVGPEVVEALAPDDARVRPSPSGRHLLDLRGVVRDRLVDVGVPSERIDVVGPSTISSETWPSYRREGATAGRMAAWIARAPRAGRAS